MLNRLYLGVIPSNIFSSFLFFGLYTDPIAGILCLMMSASFVTGFFLNRQQKFILARWVTILPVVLLINVFTCMYGRAIGGSISYLLIGVASVILFEGKSNRILIISLLTLSFFLTEWYLFQNATEVILLEPAGIIPVLVFTIDFFVMVMILLYFEESIQRSLNKADQLLKKMASQNESLTQTNYELAHFANTASHHFQSPLRHIVTLITVMDRSLTGESLTEIRKYMNLIQDDAKGLYQFVEDILMYARVGQGTEWNREAMVDLEQVLYSAASELGLSRESVRLNKSVKLSIPPNHLNLVLVKLLENSMIYNERDPVIRVQVLSDPDKQDDAVVISITDNGIGIDPKYHDQIFGMFNRLHPQHEIPGSGIGLAVCNRIVKEYGGNLELSSSNEQGSVFTLTFPSVNQSAPHYV